MHAHRALLPSRPLTSAHWHQVVRNLVTAACALPADRFHALGGQILAVLKNYRGHYDQYVCD